MTKYRIVEVTSTQYEPGTATKCYTQYRVDYKSFLFWHSLFNNDFETCICPELFETREEAELELEKYLKSYTHKTEKVIKEIEV